MAEPGYTSPFPTTHDTVGASTMANSLFMPSSPPRRPSASQESLSRRESVREADHQDSHPSPSRHSSRASTPEPRQEDFAARFADYTVDFSALDSAQLERDEDERHPLSEPDLPEEDDHLSDIGGPEDFTQNLEKYLFGGRTVSFDANALSREQERTGEEPAGQPDAPVDSRQSPKQHQPVVEDEPDVGEYSEIEPPIDMSTPSHFLRRTNGGVKDATSRLEDVEEDPADLEDIQATPSRKVPSPENGGTTESENDLRQEIAKLKDALRDRDEQLQKNRKRVLEAASAAEQIKHLQTELQRRKTMIEEFRAQGGDEASLREQIQALQKQNAEKDALLQKATLNEPDMASLQQQISSLQVELQKRYSHADSDAERTETLAWMRQQFTLTQEQLKKKDAALDETMAKLKEVTAAKELQLREKNSEIDGLKAQIDNQLLEMEKLESDLDQAQDEYRALEDRISLLEDQNRPLEEKNSSLKADLSKAQSEMAAQQKALEAVAADLPIETGGGTYTEILELIKDLGNPTPIRGIEHSPKSPKDQEIDQLHEKIRKLQLEVKESRAARDSIDQELAHSKAQATETQILMNTIEKENSRLTRRVDELASLLNTAQDEIVQLKEHAETLVTIQNLEFEDNQQKPQQPSPPPSPPTPRGKNHQQALEEAHQATLKSMQTAHATAISTLRVSHAESTRKLRDLLAAAERREAALRDELQSLRGASTSSSPQTTRQDPRMETKLRDEIARLEDLIAIKDEAASALDQRISRSFEKREREWERRVDLLLKERDRMGKALLWTIGEKENGESKTKTRTSADQQPSRSYKQEYRYKFVRPESESQRRRGSSGKTES